jgi:hypothetical protein
VPLPPSINGLKPTWAELSVCAKGQVAGQYTVNGRDMHQLRSHSLVFFSPQPAAKSLPREITPNEYYVVFAKLSDSEVVAQKKTRLLVRRQVTDALLQVYQENIHLYKHTPKNETFFDSGQNEKSLDDLFEVEDDDSNIIRDADESTQRPGRMHRLNDVVVSTSSAYNVFPGNVPTFCVTRSSDLLSHRTREYALAAFPHLHSNGLGTVYDPKRKVPVGHAEGLRHLLSIGLRTFAQDPLWTLVNFDNLNKDKGQGLMTVRFDRDKSLAQAAYNVTEEQLQALMNHQHATRRAALSGGSVPRMPPVLNNASRVLSNLKVVQSSLYGSQTERDDMRNALYGASFQMGIAQFMITLTPSNVSNGMAVHIASGGTFDFELDDINTVQRTALIQELVSKDPAACAQYFWEISLCFFRDVLGCDLETRITSQGLLGEIEWIGGGIETQGSQLLHGHVVGRDRRWPSEFRWRQIPRAKNPPSLLLPSSPINKETTATTRSPRICTKTCKSFPFNTTAYGVRCFYL